MKSLLIAVIALSTLPSFANAADFLCEGRDGVRGRVELKIFDDGKAFVVGSYNWDSQSGEDTRIHKVKCRGKLSNAGRSGNKTHDYYDVNNNCDFQYVRTQKGMAKKASGWIQLVTPGPSDHDMSGYTYASFFCR